MSELQRIDVTKLVKYDEMTENIHAVTKLMAPSYLRTFIEAQDIATTMLAKAIKEDSMAKAKLDHARAIAYLERSSEYLEAKNIKVTDESRKRYVDIDEDVMKALEHKSATEAIVVFLKGKVSKYRQAHDDTKKITYGDSNMTNWEGM